MKPIKSISFDSTRQFPKLFLDYINGEPKLNEFYGNKPNLISFKKQIELKKTFPDKNRSALLSHLKKQYKNIDISDPQKESIELLKDPKTFTVVTGHQLNIFTGPLYFVYKILSAIKLSQELKKEYTQYNFVPVYWMASEDHDFEEIQFFNYRENKYSWESDQNGAVGRFNLNGIDSFLTSLDVDDQWKEFYSNSSSLSEAHIKLVSHLFREFNIVILDADSDELKKLFSESVIKDLNENLTSNNVEKSSQKLESLNYKIQVNSRLCNYFVLDKDRFRLEKDGDGYFIEDFKGKRQEINIEELIKESPQEISPNVITRPIYQEIILPNLAYIGGPGELSYWLQLKSAFESLEVDFPILMPRFSASIFSQKSLKKLAKINAKAEDIFRDKRALQLELLERSGVFNDNKRKDWVQKIEDLFSNIESDISEIDKTLIPSVRGRKVKTLKELSKLVKKKETAIIRSEELLNARLDYVIAEVFPKESFQERHNNVLQYIEQNPDFLNELFNSLGSMFEFKHYLLEE